VGLLLAVNIDSKVLAAQTRLAQELKHKPQLYETYLMELLTMFADKGIAIQTRTAATQRSDAVSSHLLSAVCMTRS